MTFVRLETDSGIVGWGETAHQSTYNNSWKIYSVLVNEVFKEFLLGEDAMAREKILKKIYCKISNVHPDFFVCCLISAFDLALWDIAGKVCNQPIYQLLGGKYRDKIRSYSYINTDEEYPNSIGWLKPDVVAKYAKRYADMGYTGLKYDPIEMISPSGYPATPWELRLEELHRAEESVSAVREAIGPNVDIFIGTHAQLTTSSAIILGKMLERYNCAWFEEPISCENTKEM